MKTEPERLTRGENYAHISEQTERGEGQREPTVTKGVSGELSWACKPITGAALIEAAL